MITERQSYSVQERRLLDAPVLRRGRPHSLRVAATRLVEDFCARLRSAPSWTRSRGHWTLNAVVGTVNCLAKVQRFSPVAHTKQTSKELKVYSLYTDWANMADEVVLVPAAEIAVSSSIIPAEIVVSSSSIIPAPVADLLQRTPLENCQRLVVLGSARSGKSSLVAR